MKAAKKKLLCLCLVLLLAAASMAGGFFLGREKVISAGEAHLQVTVLDGFSDSPLAGAFVVIPETGQTYKTGENGKTPRIPVPVYQDARFEELLPQPWGCVTLLVYKEGYVDYALFYVQVRAGKERGNVEILMFESDALDARPFNIIEGPQRSWAEDMLNKFRPK